MKKISQRLAAVISAAAMMTSACSGLTSCLVGAFPMFEVQAAVKTQCETYTGSNVNAQDYLVWTNPIDSYLVSLDDSGFMRFQNGAVQDKYLAEYYDTSFNIGRTVLIDEELPLFGGFYAWGNYYYLLTGQSNEEESKDTECFRITKYDRYWNRVDSVGLYDCNTTVPFDAGSARFAGSGDYLFIRTSHEMYESIDGLNHQSNVTIAVDTENMTITDSFTEVSNSSYGYISHSFNQFIHVNDGKLVTLDHGDAFPRSIELTEYKTDATSGLFTPSYSNQCTTTSIVSFPECSNNPNLTGTSVGGFEISASGYLTAYAAENLDDGTLDNTTRNIYVGFVDKATGVVTRYQLTDYADGEDSASTPHLVKVNDQIFAVLWSWNGSVYYSLLDDEGNPGEISQFEGAQLSDCVPVVIGRSLVWYTWNNNVNTFHTVDVATGTYMSTVIENGHDTEILSEPTQAGGECTVLCNQCEKEFTFKTPDSVTIWWSKKGAALASTALPMTYVEDTVIYEIDFEGEYDEEFNAYEMTISDSEHVVMEQTANKGSMTFNKEGKYTVTFTHKYNPALSKSFTLRVYHYKDHTLVKTPAEEGTNMGIKECQDCDYTEEFSVPSDFRVYFEHEDGYLYSSIQDSYCVSTDFEVYPVVDGAYDDKSMTVEIDDPMIAVFGEDADTVADRITCLSEGETTIRVYPTYNPSAVKTYTLVVKHDYEEGICSRCGLPCEHDKGNSSDASCTAAAICAECGMEYGDLDSDAHTSEEVYYQQNEEDLNSHDIYYACCDAFHSTEPHIYAYDQETGYYFCVCNVQAAASVDNGEEVTYFSEFEDAINYACSIPDTKLTVLKDLELKPFSMEDACFSIDLNGKKLSISGAEEDEFALTLSNITITFEDSAGGGSISAADGAGLFYLENGVMSIMDGSFNTNGTLFKHKGGSLEFYGGSFFANEGIAAYDSTILFYGVPEFTCTTAEIILRDGAGIVLRTSLGDSKYRVSVDKVGVYAIIECNVEADPAWFELLEENRVSVLENINTYICKYDFTKAQVTLTSSENPYNGEGNPPEISVLFEGNTPEYEVTYFDASGKQIDLPKDTGEYKVVITGQMDYEGKLEYSYHITDAVPELSWASETETLVYTGAPAEITPLQVKLQGGEEYDGNIQYFFRKAGTDGAIIRGLPVNAGEYEIMAYITAFKNYTGADAQTPLLLTIEKAKVPEYDPIKLSYPFTDDSKQTVTLPEIIVSPEHITDIGVTLYDAYGLIDIENPIDFDHTAISFNLRGHDHTAYGMTAEIVLTISSQNYEDIILTVEVTMDKGVLEAEDLQISENTVVYNGKAQAPVLVPLSAMDGVGKITLSYTDAGGKPVNPVNAGEYLVSASVAEGEYYLGLETDFLWQFTIETAPITQAAVEIASPVVGEKPQMTAENGEFWCIKSIEWNTDAEEFDYNTKYAVELIFEADANHHFAEVIAVDGFVITANSGKTLTLKKEFDATPKAKILSIPAVPADRVMAMHCESAK
ncbi:MAG: hypothetical protein IKC40_08460, partial [Oscillospiraceae bacterium]|nr:hypothetical protein [Oscillospiraceae bacterium]